MNKADGGNRRFIMVQLPERLSEPKKVDGGRELRTISDIGIERLRRVSQGFTAEAVGKLVAPGDEPDDVGFRVIKLTSSNFKIWSGDDARRDPKPSGSS